MIDDKVSEPVDHVVAFCLDGRSADSPSFEQEEGLISDTGARILRSVFGGVSLRGWSLQESDAVRFRRSSNYWGKISTGGSVSLERSIKSTVGAYPSKNGRVFQYRGGFAGSIDDFSRQFSGRSDVEVESYQTASGVLRVARFGSPAIMPIDVCVVNFLDCDVVGVKGLELSRVRREALAGLASLTDGHNHEHVFEDEGKRYGFTGLYLNPDAQSSVAVHSSSARRFVSVNGVNADYDRIMALAASLKPGRVEVVRFGGKEFEGAVNTEFGYLSR